MTFRRLHIALALVLAIAACLWAAPAPAQEAVLGRWLGPRLGGLQSLVNYQGRFSPSQKVEGQNTDLSYQYHRFNALTPLSQSEKHEWALYGHAGLWALDTDAVVPYTGQKLPDNWWDLKLGTSYRRELKDGWILGGELTIGSPSDKPFNKLDDTSISATAFLRLPSGQRDAWLLMANYSNTRDFLGGIPIPGVAYAYNPSKAFTAIIGAPLLMLRYRPWQPLSLEFFYFYPRNINARVGYDLNRAWELFTAFEWKHQRYFRSDRPHEEDRWFFYQKRALVGVNWKNKSGFGVELSGGWAFDRLMFEGENYDDRHQNRIDLENGAIVNLSALYRF